MKMLKKLRIVAGLTLGLLILALALGYLFRIQSDEIPRRQLSELIQKQLIVTGTVTPTLYHNIYTIEGRYSAKPNGNPKKFRITTHLDEDQLTSLFAQNAVKIEVPGAGARGTLLNLISTLLIVGVVIMLVVYQTNIGKGKGAQKLKERPAVRFSDVAGIEEAKNEVQEIVDFLKNPRKYKRLGGTLPKGVLLIGPPGTGKTMLAKAIAGEAKADFFSAHGSDFNEVFVGVGAKRIREMFRQASKHKPSIIFIDEIDCLGRKRNLDAHGELQQTNNALLAAMDGFEASEGIVVLAATNRPEDLDEALLRPGRFDRKVHVPYPDRQGRRAILTSHSRNKPVQDPERTLDVIAQTTPGMSGADLANLMNEAAILCAQQDCSQITLAELEASRDKVRFGKERKSMVLRAEERAMVAYHEAGHTIINLQKSLLPPLYKVSIIPRGNALGVTTLLPNEDQNIHSRDLLLQELVVLMGGRAAERVFYGATTNGANGDLETAKKIVRRMVHDWGMGEKLYYEAEKHDAEAEINRLLAGADREALAIVQNQKENTEKIAKALLAQETLTREEILELLKVPDEQAACAG